LTAGVDGIKTFFFINDTASKYAARVFASDKCFHPDIIFAAKTKSGTT
jgi:hypothetical protein